MLVVSSFRSLCTSSTRAHFIGSNQLASRASHKFRLHHCNFLSGFVLSYGIFSVQTHCLQVWELDRVVRFNYGMENHGVKPF